MDFIEQQFVSLNANNKPLEIGVYEDCTLKSCDFSDSDLSDFKFIDCEFIDCNLSNAKLNQTSFQDTHFIRCKMLGLSIEDCSDFALSFSFTDCQLNHSSFYSKEMKRTNFKNCQLLEVDFTECDLRESIFDNCDLSKAIFEFTILEKADFYNSKGYLIDPEKNKIKSAKFSTHGLGGLLAKYAIEIKA